MITTQEKIKTDSDGGLLEEGDTQTVQGPGGCGVGITIYNPFCGETTPGEFKHPLVNSTTDPDDAWTHGQAAPSPDRSQ